MANSVVINGFSETIKIVCCVLLFTCYDHFTRSITSALFSYALYKHSNYERSRTILNVRSPFVAFVLLLSSLCRKLILVTYILLRLKKEINEIVNAYN